MEILSENLEIHSKYCSCSPLADTFVCFVNGKWLRKVIHDGKYESPPLHNFLTPDEVQSALQLEENIGQFWEKIFIRVITKSAENVYPLSRIASSASFLPCHLSLSQLLQYVSDSNAKNLWKDSFKRFSDHSIALEWKEESRTALEDQSTITRQVLSRLYKCPFIFLNNPDGDAKPEPTDASLPDAHPNVHPASCIVEGPGHFFVFYQPSDFSVKHCVHFSPAKLNESEAGVLFILYQLLEVMRDTQNRGLFLGNISLHHLRVDASLFLTVIPEIKHSLLTAQPDDLTAEEIHQISNTSVISLKESRPHEDVEKYTKCGNLVDQRLSGYISLISSEAAQILSQILPSQHLSKPELENSYTSCLLQLTELWVFHQISNLDYLLCLSYFCGHSLDSPIYHPMIPWVTDFSSPTGAWRDLTKTKYRLHKGDQQLDQTYDVNDSSHQEQIAHHIPEFFSEVTYYVYKARVTPKNLLQKHVRNQFVASHYPASMARMYTWSPEECILDFYINPVIFKSIHKDMPDLEIPPWCKSVGEFLPYHRSCLESNHVSRRLHHWIDLYYGYKLSGGASVKAKNVCLSLVDAHKELVRGGVVQIFNVPHPPKLTPSPFLSRSPPMPVNYFEKLPHVEQRIGTRINDESSVSEISAASFRKRGKSFLEEKSLIKLPNNYNPLSALNQVEMLFNFCLKNSGKIPQKISQKLTQTLSVKQASHLARIRDIQVVGCLIVELFASSHCSIINPRAKLKDRYIHAHKILKHDSSRIPRSLLRALKVIFQIEKPLLEDLPTSLPIKYDAITTSGLPPPSSHQLLQPLTEMIFFPPYFSPIYQFIKRMHEYSQMADESQFISDHFKKEKFVQKVSELHVKVACNEFVQLLPLPPECLQLVLPYIIDLFESSLTGINAAWYLFGPLSQALGPSDTRKHLLPHLTKMYERDIISEKQVKLFHRSFLLQLLIRVGLRCFLKDLLMPVIEGVGGLKECISGPIMSDFKHRHSVNLKQVITRTSLYDIPPASLSDDDSNSQSISVSQSTSGSHELKRSSSVKPSSVTDADITDAENDTEVFIFDGEEEDEEDDDDTIEDLKEDSASNINVEIRSPEGLDTLSLEGNYFKDPSSECQSPNSPHPSGTGTGTEEANDQSIKDDGSDSFDTPSPFQKNPPYSIPIPKTAVTGSGTTYSSSLPDRPLNLSVFKEAAAEDTNTQKDEAKPKQRCLRFSESTSGSIAEVCCESVLWLSHRLGPVLTSRYITRNLLRMLTLCYLPESNALIPLPMEAKDKLSVTRKRIYGDKSSSKIIYCLTEIANLYGEQMILLQYLSHVTELISWCEGRLSHNQEAGLIGALVLLQNIILQLSDTTFMEHLQETLIQNSLYPVIRLLSSTKVSFPSGASVRAAIAWRVVDSLYLMALRMGREMSKKKLTSPIIRFLTAFDKVHTYSCLSKRMSPSLSSKVQKGNLSYGSPQEKTETFHNKGKVLEELKKVFTPELAYLSYVPMCRFLGTKFMEESLPNHDLVRSLCLQFDENTQSHHAAVLTFDGLTSGGNQESDNKPEKRGNLLANVAVTGNRIDINVPNDDIISPSDENVPPSIDFAPFVDITKYSNISQENSQRHLRGNWFAYWEHEIGRKESDGAFNFKQIKLQTFIGHTSAVKSFCVLDNENSFMSSSRDKTIKLWSLRSQGDGNAQVSSHWTYTNHRKPVFDVVFSTCQRVAASCDSTVHIWDPFIGTCISQLDSIKFPPVSVLKAMPSPSVQLIAATTDSTIRFIDLRTCSYINELKISTSPAGLVRCVAVSDDSRLIAVAHSSGVISTLDLRTGHLLSNWKLHEGEVKDLCWLEKGIFLSSAIDQTVMVYDAYDNKTRFPLRGPAEPVHLLRPFGRELILGTTSNRIGVHTSVSPSSSFSCTKLRSDVFKGALTHLSILPLNRQLLLGSDNGTITLVC